MNKSRANTPPVKEGDEVDVYIESTGDKGDGIAKLNGFVIIVPETKKGDSVKVKITKVLDKVSFAKKIGLAETKKQSPSVSVQEQQIDFSALGEGTEDFGSDLE